MLCLGAQLCPTPCDSMDRSLPGSSVHGILQARIVEWVAIPFSRGSSHPGIEPTSLTSYALAGKFCTTSATWEAHILCLHPPQLQYIPLLPASPSLSQPFSKKGQSGSTTLKVLGPLGTLDVPFTWTSSRGMPMQFQASTT